jgi:hypothetical protein
MVLRGIVVKEPSESVDVIGGITSVTDCGLEVLESGTTKVVPDMIVVDPSGRVEVDGRITIIVE